jgi:hypothetical protein
MTSTNLHTIPSSSILTPAEGDDGATLSHRSKFVVKVTVETAGRVEAANVMGVSVLPVKKKATFFMHTCMSKNKKFSPNFLII